MIDLVTLYYTAYLTANAVYAIIRSGETMRVHWVGGPAVVMFHLPVIGRILGWW